MDLAALSLSGDLVPSVPTQLMIRYDPPTITIVYYFEQAKKDKFFHEIPIKSEFLLSNSVEDVVSDLYLREAYYFNPKQVKRPQLTQLVTKLKDGHLNPPKKQEA